MFSRALIFLSLFVLIPGVAFAEMRAYLLEAFDHVSKRKWEAKTGFAPDQFIRTHGGEGRVSVLIKATWMCYGDTSAFRPACPMPPLREPKFSIGDKVEVVLEKHITQGWVGTIELGLWREDGKSNVYGVRFGEKRNLYNRYFEFSLKLVQQATVIRPPAADGANTTPPLEPQTPTQIPGQLGTQVVPQPIPGAPAAAN